MQPATLFRCLSDETRLTCTLLLFEEGELCVCELVAALDETQPKISRHLSQLRNCELLLDRRQQQWVYYRLNPALPDWALEAIASAAKGQAEGLQALRDRLKQMPDRPLRCG